jgi:hypothetical protein
MRRWGCAYAQSTIFLQNGLPQIRCDYIWLRASPLKRGTNSEWRNSGASLATKQMAERIMMDPKDRYIAEAAEHGRCTENGDYKKGNMA